MGLDLSNDEKSFLKEQGYDERDVFDARRLSTAEWKREVRLARLTFALGSPCKQYGHRLRTRSGHCVQCDTSKLAYQRRFHTPGYVYIAGSISARLVKIGVASDIQQRESNLRNQGYGGIRDWRMLFHAKVVNGGRVEHAALTALSRYQHKRPFQKDGELVDAGEILKCSFTTAINAISKPIEDDGATELFMSPNWTDYDFK